MSEGQEWQPHDGGPMPVAWKCQERTMGAWYTRYVDERPNGERYRNIVPLYAHPPAAEPVGLWDADSDSLNGYRAAVSWISADSWDGCSDCIAVLRKARTADWQWDWAGDPQRIALELKALHARLGETALATPARTDDAEQMAAALSPPLS